MAERARQARGSARGTAATGLPEDWPRVDDFITHKLHLLTKLADRGAAELFATRHGLNLREWRVLAVIGCFAPLSLGRVAELANLDRGHGSRAVDALVTRGYVTRTRSREDGRGWEVGLSTAGRRSFDAAYPDGVERHRRLIDCLSPAEQRVFMRALERMTAEARRMNAEFDGR